MSRIWAVARHMISEGVRMKIALVFIVIILVLLPVLPFTVEGDGLTLKSRVQSFLAYSLGLVGFLLSMLTLFLSCGSLAKEISDKSILMVVSKPIPRWQYFAGKWLGIMALNAGLLAVTGIAVFGFTRYLSSRPTSVPDDAAAITHEVLTVRHAAKLTEPSWNQLVASRVRQLREEGRLDDLSTGGQAEVEEVIRDEIQRSWRAMGPRQVREFVFEDLLVDKEKDDYLHLHFKPLHTGGLPDTLFYARYEFGDPREPNTLIPGGTQEFVVDRFHSLPIPVRAVNSEGTLYVRLGNVSPTDTIMFEGDDSIELLVNIGTFHWNLFRALAILWCRLAFLAALGLLASTFVSFPVACMIGFLVLLVASSAGFLGEAMDWGEAGRVEKDPFLRASGMLRPLAMTFIWMVPNFSKFDAMGNVVSGRLVPLMWVMQSLAVLVVIKGAILGILGCTILTKRELAQATT